VSPPRLSLATLDRLPDRCARPAYDVASTQVGIIHLGIGAFHRAHQAVAVDDRLAAGEAGWGICGVSLRSPDTADALTPQDGLYTVATRSGEGERLRVVGAVRRLLVAPREPDSVLAALTDPATRLVSLTVTEKGYCHDPATGALREDHPDILADLAGGQSANPRPPRSLPGLLVEAIDRRRRAGTAPFTVLSCDNLPANGHTVSGVLAAYARLRDPDLAAYLAGEVACPSTMVDRIVPATTEADRAEVSAALGLHDAWPVMAEPFSQWVIEDRFPAGRPRFEEAGAELVADVAPYELMKLRLLNASHSALAYLGYLAGFETIADVVAEPDCARFAAALMREEVQPTLRMPAGVDLAVYERALLARFANPALRHRTWQIAMDGSQKLPQRLLGTVRDRLAAGAPFPRLALAVAAWMRYVTGRDERGGAIDVRDPLSARLRAIADEAGPVPGRLAPALLEVREVFGDDLRTNPIFIAAVTTALEHLFRRGARQALRG
jgi:fructuronate reductase